MSELPEILKSGERARLFPVLADTSREGRTLSIFLSCFETVPELGRALLASIDVNVSQRTQIEAYTEVVLKSGDASKSLRPDGLIVVTTSGRKWSALVEAKVGNTELTNEQVEGYLELARLNGIDALITLSNQFASLPTHHPVTVAAAAKRKTQLFHWSWMYVVTQASLLLSNDDVTDREQRVILREMNRFLLHTSSGVKGFDQMPASWSAVAAKILAGGTVPANSPEAREVIGAWHQELGDLSLVLSRQLEISVRVGMTRAQALNPNDRQKEDQIKLAETGTLTASLIVPDAAAAIQICADVHKRSVTASLKIKAPDEPKSSKARLNWLLKQLNKSEPKDIYIRSFWPGRSRPTLHNLSELRGDPALVNKDHETQTLLSFEILLVRDLGAKFAQRKIFLTELETAIPEFYNQVAQHVRAWQPRAPKIPEAKIVPTEVAPEALRKEAEHDALIGEA